MSKWDDQSQQGDDQRQRRDYDRPRNDGGSNEIPPNGPYKAFVGNLPPYTVQGDLDKIFSENDIFKDVRIRETYMPRDKETDKFRGFAIIEFEDAQSLQTVLQYLDGAEVNEKKLKVNVAQQKNKTGGVGGGRGGYQSRDGDNSYRGGGGHRDGGYTRSDHRDQGRFNSGPPGGRDGDDRRGGYSRDGGRDSAPRSDGPRNDYQQNRSAGGDSARPPRKVEDESAWKPSEGRPKLQLAKKTSTLPVVSPPEADKPAKANPFGAAKPNDPLAFEKKKLEEQMKAASIGK